MKISHLIVASILSQYADGNPFSTWIVFAYTGELGPVKENPYGTLKLDQLFPMTLNSHKILI